MKYKVEARIFMDGTKVVKCSEAGDHDEDFRDRTETCEIFVDVFGTEREALGFAKMYMR